VIAGTRPPKQYLEDASIVPAATRADLLLPHFIDEAALGVLLGAEESLSAADASARYLEFVRLREEAIIDEIRRVCGIEVGATSMGEGEEDEEDEEAEDLLSNVDLAEDEEIDDADFDVA
jgi:hypothetical protein